MISGFFNRLLAEQKTDPLSDDDARLALIGLLVRVARSDGDYASAEIARIDKIAEHRYGLSPAAAKALRQQAEEIEAQAPDTVRFTRAIKDGVPYEDRAGVVEALWQVVLADGVRDQDEDALMRMVAHFLGVNDVESAQIRQRVQKAT